MTARTISSQSESDVKDFGSYKVRSVVEATQPPGAYDSNEGNDDGPATIGDAVSFLINGYPLRYDCTRGINEPLSQALVEFDYEYVASPDSTTATNAIFEIDSLPIALPSMEWGLLWTVASDLGLHGCKMLNNWTESVTAANSSIGYAVVSLLSRPMDTIDPTTSSCQYLIPSSTDVCYPMRGAMIALHTSGSDDNATEKVVSDVLHLIQDSLDLQRSLTGFVNRTLFLGSRSEYAKANPTVVERRQASPNTGLFTAVFASIACIAILLVCGAYFLRLGHGRKGEAKKGESLSGAVADVEAPNMDEFCATRTAAAGDCCSIADRSTASVAVKSIGSSTTIVISNKLAEEGSPDGISIISTASTDDSAESDGAVRERPLTPTSTYTPTTKIVENIASRTMDQPSTVVLPADLPPLAPNPSSSKPSAAVVAALSNTTSRRRRKKKKRKVAKVTRVSSRENVQGMETIAEAEEADVVEDDDDDGSEYSWSTSETDGSHSRDPSPARPASSSEGEGWPTGARAVVPDDPDALGVRSRSDNVRFPRPPKSPSTPPREEDPSTVGHEC